MKKIIGLLLILVLSLSLVACSTSNPKQDAKQDASNMEDTQKQGENRSEQKPLKVGFIYVGPIGDGGYTYAHDQGRLAVEKELGLETIYAESVPEDATAGTTIANMIDQGANVIFGTSFGYMDYMEEMSKKYPDVKFLHCSGYKSTENMINYFGRMYEPRFLSGLVAGLKTQSKKIGYVAAYEIPEVIRGINAFTLGVKAVNPDATVEVVWTHTWYDPAKEKEAAVTLLDKGCDVIAQHQDTPGPIQAAEEAGKFGVAYNVPMLNQAPKAYLTAPVWNWGVYYVDVLKKIQAGEWDGQNYWGHMKDGVVALDVLSENAPAEAKEVVQEYTNKINSGEFTVFAGPIYDQDKNLVVKEGEMLNDEQLLSMKFLVDGVIGKLE